MSYTPGADGSGPGPCVGPGHSPIPDPDAVAVDEVVRLYRVGDQEVRALDGVTFRVPRGGMLGVVGPSGSGKSTLLGILGCLDRPSSGRHLFGGVDTASLDDDR